ncbi:hypothetical protein [Bradyrhizobium sp.]|uniref:hypothetical protein n=1 Tax=Bradyrhizobium sp. TaxID=376 RepID=UPI00271A9861|nr:hypothetical protein [Bradyrhizobium sp.]MDO9297205.1 hypothetical protein [Bradyrhizobium sp.]
MDDSVQVCCTRCRNVFRDRARRVQAGYSRQCPCCEVVLFFEETSLDKNITRALTSARGLRKVLREMEAAGPRKAKAVPAGRRSY